MGLLGAVAKTLVAGAKIAGTGTKVVAQEALEVGIPIAAHTAQATLEVTGKSVGLQGTPFSPADLTRQVIGNPTRQNFRDLFFARRALLGNDGGGPIGGSGGGPSIG